MHNKAECLNIFRAAQCVPMLPLGLKETKEVDFKTALEVLFVCLFGFFWVW